MSIWSSTRGVSLSQPIFAPSSQRERIFAEILRSFEGVDSVRVLARGDRASTRDKVYVVLATHDVRRDSRIVEVLCQLDDVDFDLVPVEAQGMIPNAAQPVRALS